MSKRAGFWEKLTYKIYKTENIFHNKTSFLLRDFDANRDRSFFLSAFGATLGRSPGTDKTGTGYNAYSPLLQFI